MNDHNLDDLIIDTIAPKNNKTKSLLTIVALLIVVLIVAIILTKTLLKSPDDETLTFEENVSETIAPELKLQEPETVAKPKEEASLPNLIEETVTPPKEVKEPELVEEISRPVATETVPKVEETLETEEAPVTTTKKVVSKPKETKPVVKEPVKPKVTTRPKTEVKKPVTKPVKKPTVKQSTPQTSSTGTYYVQVGSFKENPSPRFLSVIKSSGFKYHVSRPDRTGYKKLLIGPYKTRADVDKARDIVRDRINKTAFVVEK